MARRVIGRIIVILLLGAAFNVKGQSDLDEVAAGADAAYNAGDYSGAVTAYSALLEAGVHDATIYYNLGNAYYQLNDPGRALLNYRRAQALRPRDRELNINLALVRAQRIDVQEDDGALLHALAESTYAMLTLRELSWLVASVWCLGCSLLATWLLMPDYRQRLRLPLVISALLVGVGFAVLFGRVYVDSARPPAVIIDVSAEVMSGPGGEYLPIFHLYSGTELRLLQSHSNWVRFVLPDGRQGWLPRTSVETIRRG